MQRDFNLRHLPRLARESDRRILFVVLDGLGGVLGPEPTALQRAHHPHLDELARESALGRHLLLPDGITPGSGPGHLALFGYDAVGVDVGRGVLEALGLGMDLAPDDLAARGNFCTLDDAGCVADRRAGRIATKDSRPLAMALGEQIDSLGDVAVEVCPGQQHRFAVVFRGPGLRDGVGDTDPQVVGVPPRPAKAESAEAERSARTAEAFAERARAILADRRDANAVLLRGISRPPAIPTLREMALLTPCAIAAYPAYRGIARVLGMEVLWDLEPSCSVADEVAALESVWKENRHDFFFFHVKGTDSAGEDGDEARKARVIEEFDAVLPRMRALNPDVILVTGDHATPGPLAGHSWHPVPFLLHGPWCEPDDATSFDEATCQDGRFGPRVPADALIRLVLANAERLAKFGA